MLKKADYLYLLCLLLFVSGNKLKTEKAIYSPEQIQHTLTAIELQTGLTVYNMPKNNEYFAGLKLEA